MKPYIEWICHARLVSSWVFSHGDIALHAKSSVSGKETVVDWMLILVQNLRPWQTRTHCCRHKCFPVCQRAQHLLRTQKTFLILFRNISCPQQMFPSLRSPRNIMGNNVSSFTRVFNLSNNIVFPRLPFPRGIPQSRWVLLYRPSFCRQV